MFSNFIYFIVVLLIYTTHQPPEKAAFAFSETVLFFAGLLGIFIFLTKLQFQRLEKRISTENFSNLDHRFNTLLTRQSIMAIVLFAIDIYGLNLSSFTADITVFRAIPTLQAVLFIGLFVLYMAVVWAGAHGAYQKLYLNTVTRRSYILSNISFSIPVLLPWLLLSGIADLINLLPFTIPKQFLATPTGEVIYFLFFLCAVALLGPVMIQKFWRCTPLEAGATRERIENLCRQTGIGYNNILYWPIFGGKMITAGVMGLVTKFRYILVTHGLLRLLEPEELDAVIAHEIGHVKQKHLLFYLFFFAGYMLVSYGTFDLLVFAIIYAEPVYRFVHEYGFSQASVTAALFSIVIILNFVIYFRYIFGYFMRNFERQADTYVYAVIGNAQPLIRTLEKIALTSGQPPDRPNWHHFSITERIAYLKKCENDGNWIRRHNRKIKKSIAVYLAAVLLMGALGYHLNFGSVGQKLNNHFFEKIIQRELQKTPHNPNLYRMLGDLYYSRKDYETTIRAYENALGLRPDNPEVLNNLAWLFATCDDPNYRDPQKALRLAQQAATLSPAAHIMDTLAESFYVNGKYAEAAQAAERALQLARTNRSYFEDQLEKFRTAERKAKGF
ncbi:MAG: M48 family metalloprotease [Desulfobacterales bacterium]|nr:M48 family metalloprotease [Desulfobacterales bacterium]